MIVKYFWDGSVDVGNRCRTTLNSCVCYYFSYGVIFVVFSRSFVGVDNFIWVSVDYPTERFGWFFLYSNWLRKIFFQELEHNFLPSTQVIRLEWIEPVLGISIKKEREKVHWMASFGTWAIFIVLHISTALANWV